MTSYAKLLCRIPRSTCSSHVRTRKKKPIVWYAPTVLYILVYNFLAYETVDAQSTTEARTTMAERITTTKHPTHIPTQHPTQQPTLQPTPQPTHVPTTAPSVSLTCNVNCGDDAGIAIGVLTGIGATPRHCIDFLLLICITVQIQQYGMACSMFWTHPQAIQYLLTGCDFEISKNQSCVLFGMMLFCNVHINVYVCVYKYMNGYVRIYV